MNFIVKAFFLLLAITIPASSSALASADEGSRAAKDRDKPLLIRDNSWDAYRERVESDTRLAPMRSWLVAEANRLLEQPILDRPDGKRRILTTSRFVVMRTLVLGQAYHLTGDRRYADRAIDELLSAASLDSWNPSHMLDTAEMATGVAIGLDWFDAALTDEQRDILREALLTKGLLAIPTNHWSFRATNNWNSVVCAGAALAAITLEDEHPQAAQEALETVTKSMQAGWKAYEPDGVSYEGPGYWSYGATYSAILLSALSDRLDRPVSDLATPSLRLSAEARMHLDGPTGIWFNFGDTFGINRLEPALLFFADEYDEPFLSTSTWPIVEELPAYVEDKLRTKPDQLWLMPLTLAWAPQFMGEQPIETQTQPIAWGGDGRVPLAVLRSGDDANSTYVAIKGGQASVSHQQLDAGSFVLDMKGVRWAIDLGAEDYPSAEAELGRGFWNRRQDSPRFELTRYNNRNHNTLSINGTRQRVDQKATVADVAAKPYPTATVDLSTVYDVEAATRTVRLTDDGGVVIEDSLAGVDPADEAVWNWVTDASVTQESPHTIRLDKADQTIFLHFVSGEPASVNVTSLDEERRSFEQKLPGVVAIRVTMPVGDNKRARHLKVRVSETP